MSRGPLPAEIYWRRRFLLLAVLLLIAYGVVTLWPDGSDAGPAAADPTPSTSASASADADAESAAEEDPAPEEPASRDTTVSLAAGGEPCDPETIRTTPHVPPDQSTGGPVRIQLTLSTTSEKPCTFRPRPGDLPAVVSVGGNAVWDSDVCRDAALVDGAVALSPQWSTVADATWSGRGSGTACSDEEGWAAPGKYALRVGTLGGEPGKTTFRLAAEATKDESADEQGEGESEQDASGESGSGESQSTEGASAGPS